MHRDGQEIISLLNWYANMKSSHKSYNSVNIPGHAILIIRSVSLHLLSVRPLKPLTLQIKTASMPHKMHPL